MISEKFKSKAKNIALKSFIKECEKRGWYLLLLNGSIALTANRNTDLENLANVIRKGMRKKCDFPFTLRKDLFAVILNSFSPLIERNVQHSSFPGSNEEYDYLVHCVNTLIQIFIEHGIMKTVPIKDTSLEAIGRSIFTRAARKIFGNDFKIIENEEKKDGINSPFPLNEEEEEFLRKRIFVNHMKGLNDHEAIKSAVHQLMMLRTYNQIVVKGDNEDIFLDI